MKFKVTELFIFYPISRRVYTCWMRNIVGEYKKFTTVLIVGGQRLKITPIDSDWDILMVNYIQGKKPLNVIQEIEPEGDEQVSSKFPLFSFNEDSADSKVMNLKISKNTPFICYLSRKTSSVQFVFASKFNTTLQMEQINVEKIKICEQTPNFKKIFMDEIPRIMISEKPLLVLSAFLSRFENRAFFKCHHADFDPDVSDAIHNLLMKIKPFIGEQAAKLIKFIDMQMVLGKPLTIVDAMLLIKAIDSNPSVWQKIIHTILHTKHVISFLVLLLNTTSFDSSIFLHRIQYTENVSMLMIFKILQFIIDHQVPFHSGLVEMFTPHLPSPLLKILLQHNKIVTDSLTLALKLNAKGNCNFQIDNQSKVVFQSNLITIQPPNRSSIPIIFPSQVIYRKMKQNNPIQKTNQLVYNKEWSFSKSSRYMIFKKTRPQKIFSNDPIKPILQITKCCHYTFINQTLGDNEKQNLVKLADVAGETEEASNLDVFYTIVILVFLTVMFLIWNDFSIYVD